jgi:tetratricopeptide (TPR) repeat protein
MMAGDFYMQVMARVLFSIAVLTIATPATSKNVDRGMAVEVQNPKMAEYYLRRGTVHYYMDKYDDAITDYDLAIRLRRNYADAYYNRGLAFDGKGLLQQALGDLRKALTCNAFSIQASPWRGEARAKISEIETKLSVTGNLQAQTSATSVDETLVK